MSDALQSLISIISIRLRDGLTNRIRKYVELN